MILEDLCQTPVGYAANITSKYGLLVKKGITTNAVCEPVATSHSQL